MPRLLPILTFDIGEKTQSLLTDLGALALRVSFGLMMPLAHGLPKLMSFAEKSAGFPDPLGVGSPFSMALAIFAEVLCSLGVLLGLFTRWALIPLIFTMLVAFFIIHGDDSFAVKEKALAYLVAYASLFLLGPGRFSLDHLIGRRRA